MITRQTRSLSLTIPDAFRKQLLKTGQVYDINQGGHYDSSGCMVVNVWCAPDDKPSCWDQEIDQGALDYPREFVGTISFQSLLGGDYRIELEASPYQLKNYRAKRPNEHDLESCLDWMEKKTRELIKLANAEESFGLVLPVAM